jgi:hypothetical protein
MKRKLLSKKGSAGSAAVSRGQPCWGTISKRSLWLMSLAEASTPPERRLELASASAGLQARLLQKRYLPTAVIVEQLPAGSMEMSHELALTHLSGPAMCNFRKRFPAA